MLNIKVRILDSIYSAEKAVEVPSRNEGGKGIFDRKQKTYLKGWLRVDSFTREIARSLRNSSLFGMEK